MMTAPTTLWRVTDKSSRSQYYEGEGILAEDQNSRITFNSRKGTLRWVLGGHLIWELRRASPFISTYSNRHVAWKQAKQRVERGKEDVKIHKIDVNASNKPVEYRNVQGLAFRLRMEIPQRALHHSEYEYVFLGHIPDRAVTACYEFKRVAGMRQIVVTVAVVGNGR